MASKHKTKNNGVAKFQARNRLANLMTSSELDESEILIAIERYQLFKAQLAKARAQNKNTFTQLPGTDLLTPEDERLSLARRAKELEVSSGLYEDWELVQFGDHIVKMRDEQHLDFYLDLIDFAALSSQLLRRLDIITIQVLRTPGNLWVDKPSGGKSFPFSESDAGQLSKVWTELNIIAERLEIDLATIPPVYPFVNGIRKLINEKDRGQALRETVDKYDPATFEAIQDYADTQPRAGAKPKGVIDRLCQRAKPYMESSEYTYGTAFDKMIEDLDRDDLNRLEKQEAEKLKNWSAESFEKAYRLRMGKQITSVT